MKCSLGFVIPIFIFLAPAIPFGFKLMLSTSLSYIAAAVFSLLQVFMCLEGIWTHAKNQLHNIVP